MATAAQSPPEQPSTLFLEDTVELKSDTNPLIGVIARTWHDLDEQPDEWEEVDLAIRGSSVVATDFMAFQSSGTPPRYHVLLVPSAPENPPMLVREGDCKLLDRSLSFGDVVKRSLTDPMSGTVTAIETEVNLRHSFPGPSQGLVVNVPDQELEFVGEWAEGDFVIYKNSWVGMVDEVFEEVAVRLSNGSVVFVENPLELEVPIGDYDGQMGFATGAANGLAAGETTVNDSNGTLDTTASSTASITAASRPITRPKAVPAPDNISPGQHVMTSKANLRRGKWVYGAYNASIPAVGVVVDVVISRLRVNWILQNMIVPGRFIAVPRPPTEFDVKEEEQFLKKFHKSTAGLTALDGSPLSNNQHTAPALQVGDRLRFRDLAAAVEKYQGQFQKVPRTDTLGFDVNTFLVVDTRTRVRISWQDMTESIDDAISVVPYLNIDDHDCWPGEIVAMKEADGAAEQQQREQFEGIWRMWNSMASLAQPGLPPAPAPDFQRLQKLAVVQRANSADRLASVRWFKDANIEIGGGVLIPLNSRTGALQEEEEDVSFYEVVPHPALACRRGDFVLIAPEHIHHPQSASATGDSTPTNTAAGTSPDAARVGSLENSAGPLRGMFDDALLSNLSAALGSSSHPQLQAVSRMLTAGLATGMLPSSPAAAHEPANTASPMDYPVSWIGEVVDLRLDGLITVRLGAKEDPSEVIQVPIERLHVIFSEDMDDLPFDDDDEDEFSDSDSDMDDPIIEERIIYQGGQRLDNGEEEDWETDEEDNMDVDGASDDGMLDLESVDIELEDVDDEAPQRTIPINPDPPALAPSEPPQTEPPQPVSSAPKPEAFSIPQSNKAPARFLVLDTPVPSDHAHASQTATALSGPLMRRINREHRILESSLPEGILVRTWESRLDLLRVMIIGPLNTPYELAPFVFDFWLPNTFPAQPPKGFFHSWTNGIGRVNPNLYEDGTMCLSLLGTWHAERKAESWSAGGSSILQLLVSLMGLVLVREPWYNEAGFTVFVGAEEESALNSRLYSEKAYILARSFVKRVIQRPVAGFEEELAWLYLPHRPSRSASEGEGMEVEQGPELLKQVVEKARVVVKRSEGSADEETEVTTDGIGKVTAGALVLLKRDLKVLEELLEAHTRAIKES